MIKENSKIYLKDSSIFNDSVKVGTEFTVVEITKNNIKFESDFGFGIMNMKEFEEYFTEEKEEDKKSSEWSEWKYLTNFSCEEYKVFAKFKGRQTHVIVKMENDIIASGRSYAFPGDYIIDIIGVMIAISKAFQHIERGKTQTEKDVLKDNPKLRKVWF